MRAAFTSNSTSGTWSGNGTLNIGNGGVFTNAGTLTATGNGTVTNNFAGGTGTFANSGTLVKNTVTGVTTITQNFPLTFSNSGTLDVESGSLAAIGFTNNGTITLKATGVANTLTVNGNLSLAPTSVLNVKIGGAAAGQYGNIHVTGSATLRGTLNSSLINGFVPSGQSFDVITATTGPVTGSFTTLTLPVGINGAIVGNVFRLTESSGVCTGVCWDGGAGTTSWADAANWTGDALPGASDLVQLNLVSGVTVTHASGNDSIKGLSSIANNHLIISGGSLTLNDPGTTSTLAGNLTLSGSGTLTNNGILNAAVLNMTGGTFNGAGNLTVSTDFNQSGGSFAPTGSIDLTRTLGNLAVGALNTNGTIKLKTVGAFDVVLAGDLQATNSGLLNTQPAINVTSGRDILLNAVNLTTTTSGGVKLTAANTVNLSNQDMCGGAFYECAQHHGAGKYRHHGDRRGDNPDCR